MSETTGETPTPKRGPGRPRKIAVPEIVAEEMIILPTKTPEPFETGPESETPLATALLLERYELGRELGREEGYREGWNACAQKHKPAMFEAAKRWALEHAGTFHGNAKAVELAMNDGFD